MRLGIGAAIARGRFQLSIAKRYIGRMPKDGPTDAPSSSRSSFQRFERVMKALMAVPKKEVDAKAVEHPRKRRARKRTA